MKRLYVQVYVSGGTMELWMSQAQYDELYMYCHMYSTEDELVEFEAMRLEFQLDGPYLATPYSFLLRPSSVAAIHTNVVDRGMELADA